MPQDTDSKFRQLFKGSGVVFFGLVFEMGFSFVAVLLIARFFGKVDFGAVSIGVTVMGFAATLSLLGLNQGIGRNLPRYAEDSSKRGVILSAYQLALPTSLLIGGCIAFFAPVIASRVFSDPTIGPILRVFAAAVPAVVLVRLSMGVIQGLKQTRGRVVVRNVVIPGTRFVIVLAVLITGYQIIGIAYAYAFAYVIAAIVGTYYVLTKSTLLKSVKPVGMHASMLRFSAPLVVSTAMTNVLVDIDTLLLGVSPATTTGGVGVYRVVYPIASLLPIVLTALSFLFVPIISELHSQGAYYEMHRMYQVATKWAVFPTIPVFFAIALFPKTVISLTFGPQYVVGEAALIVLAVGFFIPVLAGPNSSALTSIGKTNALMYVDVITAMTNVALNLYLIPQYSILGAAIATSVAYGLQNLFYSAILFFSTKIHPFSRSLYLPGSMSIIIGIAMWYATITNVKVTPLVFLGLLITYTIIHFVVILSMGGIEREEVMIVLSFEERYGVDLGPLKRVASWFI